MDLVRKEEVLVLVDQFLRLAGRKPMKMTTLSMKARIYQQMMKISTLRKTAKMRKKLKKRMMAMKLTRVLAWVE